MLAGLNSDAMIRAEIISKHHYSYLKPFGGSTEEFSKYIEFLKEEYNMNVEINSENLLVLTK